MGGAGGDAVSESRAVAIALAAVALMLLVLAVRLRLPAHLAPLAILVPTCGLLLVEVAHLWGWRRRSSSTLIAEHVRKARRAVKPVSDDPSQGIRERKFVAWLVGLVAGNLLLGPGVGVPLFLLLWLVLRARQGWAVAIAVAAPAALLIGFLLPWGLGIRLPPGIVGTVLLP